MFVYILVTLTTFFIIISFTFFKKHSKRTARILFVKNKDLFNKVLNNQINETLNRIKIIAHDNRQFQIGYDVWKIQYKEIIQKQEETIKQEIKAIDSLFSSTQKSELIVMNEKLNNQIEELDHNCQNFLEQLKDFIKLNTLHREEIIFLQRAFREIVEFFEEKRTLSLNTASQIEENITEIEKLFEQFETAMKTANFVFTKKLIQKISEELQKLILKVNLAPQINYYTNKCMPKHIRSMRTNIINKKEAGARFDETKLCEVLSSVENQLIPIELTSKMKNFLNCKILIEKNLSKLQIVQQTIYKEVKSQKIFESEKHEVLNALKKTYAITKTISPLLHDVKNKVTLNNTEKATIIAFNNKIYELKKTEIYVKTLIKNNVDKNYSQLLDELLNLARLIRETLRAIHLIFILVDKKQSSDLRCDREARNLSLAISELSSGLSVDKFIQNDEYFQKLLSELKNKFNEIKHSMMLKPRALNRIEIKLDMLRKLINSVSKQIYTTTERFKIAEKEIMWMSRYREESVDLNSLLQEAEIAFNQKDLKQLEKVLKIAGETTIVKKFKEK